jgi:hypothetical protein
VRALIVIFTTLALGCEARRMPAPAIDAAPRGQATWGVAYQDPDGRYAARFPRAPKVDGQVAQGELGAVASSVARVPSDAGIFTTMSVTFPVPADTPVNVEALLRVARDQVLVEVKGRVVAERRVDHDGLVGLDFDYEGVVVDAPVVGRAMVFVAADPATARIASVFGEPAQKDQRLWDAFLAAFVPTPAAP